jgi:hypothetical protein
LADEEFVPKPQFAKDGVVLAVFGAMVGALIAQLAEFQPLNLAGLLRTIGLSIGIIVLCVSGMASAACVVTKSRWIIVSLGIFVAALGYFFWPEMAAIWKQGSTGLEAQRGLKELAIKLTVAFYMIGWCAYTAVEEITSESRK